VLALIVSLEDTRETKITICYNWRNQRTKRTFFMAEYISVSQISKYVGQEVTVKG